MAASCSSPTPLERSLWTTWSVPKGALLPGAMLAQYCRVGCSCGASCADLAWPGAHPHLLQCNCSCCTSHHTHASSHVCALFP